MNMGLAYATNGIGNILGHETKSFGTEILRAGMHGVVNGAGSAINGESFGTGFLIGSVSSLVGSGVSALGSPSYLTIPAMGGVGGIVSELSGGNWFDGVRTGINIGLFNHGWEKINGEWYYVSDGVEIIGHRRNVMSSIHMMLDIAGFIFDIADLFNSGLYAFEGDCLNACISGTAAIPFFGTIATSGKNAMNAAEILSKYGSKYTNSSLKQGREIHKLYKVNVKGNEMIKEYNGLRGHRPDFVDFQNHKIYELKPYNPQGVKTGIKQLNRYKNAFEAETGKSWSTYLDFY